MPSTHPGDGRRPSPTSAADASDRKPSAAGSTAQSSPSQPNAGNETEPIPTATLVSDAGAAAAVATLAAAEVAESSLSRPDVRDATEPIPTAALASDAEKAAAAAKAAAASAATEAVAQSPPPTLSSAEDDTPPGEGSGVSAPEAGGAADGSGNAVKTPGSVGAGLPPTGTNNAATGEGSELLRDWDRAPDGKVEALRHEVHDLRLRKEAGAGAGENASDEIEIFMEADGIADEEGEEESKKEDKDLLKHRVWFWQVCGLIGRCFWLWRGRCRRHNRCKNVVVWVKMCVSF